MERRGRESGKAKSPTQFGILEGLRFILPGCGRIEIDEFIEIARLNLLQAFSVLRQLADRTRLEERLIGGFKTSLSHLLRKLARESRRR